MSQEDWRFLPFALLLMFTGKAGSTPRRPMTHQLTRYAVLTLVRGTLIVAFAVVCLASADPSPGFMLRAFAVLSLADGLVAFAIGYGAGLPQPILSGALSIVIGVIALALDDASAGTLTLMVMSAAAVRGLSDLSMAQLFRYSTGRHQALRSEAILSLGFVVALGIALALDNVAPALMTTYAALAGVCLFAQSVSTSATIASIEPGAVIRAVARRAPRSA